MSLKNLFLLGFIGVLLAAIPVTVYYLQQQQETRTKAEQSTTLSLIPAAKTVNAQEKFTLDINMDPGKNVVIGTTLSINYEPSKVATVDAGLVANSSAFPNMVGDIVYSSGNILVTMQTGLAEPQLIRTPTKVATINFKALSETTSTDVSFGNETAVFATLADPETNVLSTKNSAKITINASATSDTPTPTVPAGTPAPTIANQPPNCLALNADRTTTGTAPFAITFTAVGNDADGTITKATFNFGDGPVQDVTTAGGIGTNSVNVQSAHSYQNPGTYSASVILTDNKGAVSALGNCTKTITVTQGTGAPIATPTAQIVQISNPTPTIVSAQPTIVPPGASESILGAGIAGAALTIIGAILFFAL